MRGGSHRSKSWGGKRGVEVKISERAGPFLSEMGGSMDRSL